MKPSLNQESYCFLPAHDNISEISERCGKRCCAGWTMRCRRRDGEKRLNRRRDPSWWMEAQGNAIVNTTMRVEQTPKVDKTQNVCCIKCCALLLSTGQRYEGGEERRQRSQQGTRVDSSQSKEEKNCKAGSKSTQWVAGNA